MDELELLDIKDQKKIELVQEIGKIYSKKKCKHCLERGYLLFDMIDKNDPKAKYITYCYCVRNKMKNYK